MIFSRFYKQDEFSQGAGLGLSICQVIVEKLRGQNRTVVGTGGKEAGFTVVLPVVKLQATSDELQVPFGVVVWRIIIRLRIQRSNL